MTRELRIYGPPGTGKTSTLRRRVEATVKERGAASIRIASLTRAAAAEIGSRVDLPREQVGTLHSHAFHALDRPDLAETPEGVEAWNHVAHKLGEAFVLPKRSRAVDLDDAGGEALVPSTEGEGLLQNYSMLRARCTPRELWPPAVQSFAEHWERFKHDANRLDFNDLIERAALDVPTMPGSPRVFLLDEAQDMSRLDMLLARQWGEACDVFVVVGDPDQNLYQWRGSEPEAFTGVDAADTTVLERSYRVPKAVHAYATGWLTQTLPTRSDAAYRPRLLADGTEAPGRVRRSPHTHREPDALAHELEGHLDAGRRVMVLAACGFMLDPLIAILRRRGVPFGNPYRTNDGRLNPLAGAGRVCAFLAAQPQDRGGLNRLWTWDEVRRWAEPLKASAVLDRGAKTFIEYKCADTDRFVDTPAGERTVELSKVLALLKDDDARSAVVDGDLDWYERNLLASRASTLAYSLNVARSRGGHALRAQPTADGGAGVILGTIHCSPPDEPVLTKRGYVAIADLRFDDRLVGYHRGTNTILGLSDHPRSLGYTFERSTRPYEGALVVIATAASRTRVTPNHRVVARFDEDTFCGRWTVYLMRKGDWWRCGICTTAHRPYRSGGVAGRLATEQADAGWILGVFDTRADALKVEAFVQAVYGIPGLTFRAAAGRALTTEQLEYVHDAARHEVRGRVDRLLGDLGLNADWPLYVRGDIKRNMRGNFETEAANLVALSGRVMMLTATGRKPTPLRAEVTTEFYDGPVYGLDVPPHHYYVSGGAVVHNSVKGGEAEVVYVFPDLSRAGFEGWLTRGPRHDAVSRQMYVAMTRARDELVLCEPSAAYAVQFPTIETGRV